MAGKVTTLQGIGRFLLYALLVALVAGLVVWSAEHSADGLGLVKQVPGSQSRSTTEFSLVENIQHLLLLVCSVIFFWISLRDRLRRPLAIALASLFLIGLVREIDFFLDHYAVDNLWQVLAALLTVISGVYLYRHRRRLEAGWQRSWPSAGLAMIIAGVILLAIFAQLLARQTVWLPTLGDGYLRVAVLAFEELMELGAYLVITIGSIEFLYTWSRLPETRAVGRSPRRWTRRK